MATGSKEGFRPPLLLAHKVPAGGVRSKYCQGIPLQPLEVSLSQGIPLSRYPSLKVSLSNDIPLSRYPSLTVEAGLQDSIVVQPVNLDPN